ncbi:MAG: tetraacyldisaccharide 4'-kinase [Myxococcales bacterium]|nr:tetraacyldisaccharide 4'-kinase [Myxococcales bacterium]
MSRLTGAAYHRRPNFPWNILSALLIPFGLIYGLILSLRARAYRQGWFSAARPVCRVVSVGNLTLGGTGKTPVTAWLARDLKDSGQAVAVVSRGYRGSREGWCCVVSDGATRLLDAGQAGDEPVLLADALPGVPVIISARRSIGVETAVSRFSSRIVICDDAFSHLALRRDLDLVLIHGRDGLGNGRCFPAGPLREPAGAIRRAGAVLLNVTAGEEPEVEPEIRRSGFTGPIFRFRYGQVRLASLSDRRSVEPAADKPLLAFAAIARPEDFFQGLARAGWPVAASRVFPDHHLYTPSDLSALIALAKSQNISRLATTAKDAVKLPAKLPANVEILVADFSLEGPEGELRRLSDFVAARLRETI